MLKDKGTGYLHPQHTLHFPESLVRQVSSFRYFGITLDNKLSFDSHNTTSTNTASKDSPPSTNSKHFLLPPHPPSVAALQEHNSIHNTLLLPCFLTKLFTSNKNKLSQITHTASKIVGCPTPDLSDLSGHPLNPFFILRPSGHKCRTLHVLVSSAIAVMNCMAR